MLSTLYADVLREAGFELIGRLDYRFQLTLWWHPQKFIQVLTVVVGRLVLVRGDKSYFLKSVGAEGETWVRDLPQLHDFLETHFPQLRLSFSFCRNVSPSLAKTEVQRRMAVESPTLPMPTPDDIAQLQRQLLAKQQSAQSDQVMMGLSAGGNDLLSSYMRQESRNQQTEINDLNRQIESQQQRLSLLLHLQKEYEQKGSAASYCFSISSNVLFAEDPPRFRDALAAVVKELCDLHRFQVTQKLSGSRLNIQIGEAKEPAITWIEQWFGGGMSPAQMRQFIAAFDALRKSLEEQMVVTPDQPIVAADHVRRPEKHLAARVVSDMLQRLDPTPSGRDKTSLSPDALPAGSMPLALGHRVDENGKILGPVAFPLAQMVHLFISGTTGSGKSFIARVLIEEAAAHKQLNILVLDPRDQSIGMLVPEDRPKIIAQYPEFGMKPADAAALQFRYFAPGLDYAPGLPADLSSLAKGRAIVSLKGLDDSERCASAARILKAVFSAVSTSESEGPRLLVVVDEAHLFTRRRLDESAREAASQAERALDLLTREGRKFGLLVAISTQSVRDFGYELASIRQMTSTKVFMRNSDSEIPYAADIIGDGRLLVSLPSGTALIHHPDWGLTRVRIRPPRSKVFELPADQARQLVGKGREPSKAVSVDAQRLYAVIQEHGSVPTAPLNLSRAGELAGITSKRRLLELIGELEDAGLIRTRRLAERGRPRVIELVRYPVS